MIADPARAAVTEAWVQRYSGPSTGADRQDNPYAVAVDASGNVVVTGSSWGTNSNYDIYTAKYAATKGALIWERRYNGPANGDDNAWALAVDDNGNAVVTGGSFNGVNNDFYTAKYAAADGALLWERRYNGWASATAMALDTNGNVAVTGVSVGSGTGEDYYTAKYAAADGALIWHGPVSKDDYPTAVAVDGDGNVIVTGNSNGGSPSSGGTSWDYYTAKYAAANGALLWEKRYSGPGTEEANAVAVDSHGNVVVTGFSVGGGGNVDCYTAKYAAADGTLLWEKRYDGPGNGDDTGSAVAVDNHDNVVVTGSSFNGSTRDLYTAKYAATDGSLLWEMRYNGPANGDEVMQGHSLTLGANGMVSIAGSSAGSSGVFGDTDYAIVVYWETLPPVSMAVVPEGMRLRFAGVPDRIYSIERAPSVAGPWSTIATPAAPLDGVIEFVDINAPRSPAFYRTSSPQQAKIIATEIRVRSTTTLANSGDLQNSSLTPTVTNKSAPNSHILILGADDLLDLPGGR